MPDCVRAGNTEKPRFDEVAGPLTEEERPRCPLNAVQIGSAKKANLDESDIETIRIMKLRIFPVQLGWIPPAPMWTFPSGRRAV